MHNRKQSLQDGKGNTATSFSKSYRAWCVQQGRGVTSSFLDCHACSQLARLLGFVKHRWGYIRIGTLKTRVSEVGKKQFCYLALVFKATWTATPELSLETILTGSCCWLFQDLGYYVNKMGDVHIHTALFSFPLGWFYTEAEEVDETATTQQ